MRFTLKIPSPFNPGSLQEGPVVLEWWNWKEWALLTWSVHNAACCARIGD